MSTEAGPRPGSGELPRLVRWAGSPWSRLVVLAVVLGTFGWLGLTCGGQAVDLVKAWVAQLDVVGPVVFVLLYAAASMAFFPVSVLSGVAGVLFGPALGVPLVWLGCMLGAVGAFGVGRGMSRPAVERLAGGRLTRTNALLARHGGASIALLRLFPVGPFAMLNYLVAVTSLRPKQFLLGTGIGILPGVVIYTVLGGTVGDPASPAFLLSALALVVLIVGGAIGARRIARRSAADTSPD